MSEHTPAPWRVKRTQGYQVIAGDDAEPYTVANCWSGPFAPAKEIACVNAALIVRCVNAHDALVSACRAAYSLIGQQWAGPSLEVSEQLRAALAAAQKGTP